MCLEIYLNWPIKFSSKAEDNKVSFPRHDLWHRQSTECVMNYSIFASISSRKWELSMEINKLMRMRSASSWSSTGFRTMASTEVQPAPFVELDPCRIQNLLHACPDSHSGTIHRISIDTVTTRRPNTQTCGWVSLARAPIVLCLWVVVYGLGMIREKTYFITALVFSICSHTF